MAKSLNAKDCFQGVKCDRQLYYLIFEGLIFFSLNFGRVKNMSEEKGNLKGLAVSFILISLIMGAGVGIVYFIGQSIY